MIAFTKSLAREVARYHITVNCVCPGPTDTPLFAAQPEKVRLALEKAIPFRRIAKPQELADAILFFASAAFGLCHRAGAERQRWADDGGIGRRTRCCRAMCQRRAEKRSVFCHLCAPRNEPLTQRKWRNALRCSALRSARADISCRYSAMTVPVSFPNQRS